MDVRLDIDPCRANARSRRRCRMRVSIFVLPRAGPELESRPRKRSHERKRNVHARKWSFVAGWTRPAARSRISQSDYI